MEHKKKVLVIKYGSKCVVDGVGLDQARIDEYARKIAGLRKTYEILIVASGSVATGKRFCAERDPSGEVLDAQVLASIGSAGANEAWRLAFKQQNVLAGQVLITHKEIDDQKEGDKLIMAIQNLFGHGVIPVVNENDILSSNELKKLAYGGDNDGLASHIAVRLSAAAVLFLTDTEGYIENNELKTQVKITEIDGLQQHLQNANQEGTGSMQSKLEAAARAAAANTKAFIANAGAADYQQILAGRVGTEVVQ